MVALLPLAARARAASSIRPCEITVEVDHQVVDIAHGLVTRPGRGGRMARARVPFSDAERDTLCSILAQGRVFDLPWSFGSGSPHVLPELPAYHFTIRLGARTKEFWWRPDWDPSARRGKPGPDPRQDFLFEFSYRLDAMLRRSAAYRALPQLPPRQ